MNTIDEQLIAIAEEISGPVVVSAESGGVTLRWVPTTQADAHKAVVIAQVGVLDGNIDGVLADEMFAEKKAALALLGIDLQRGESPLHVWMDAMSVENSLPIALPNYPIAVATKALCFWWAHWLS